MLLCSEFTGLGHGTHVQTQPRSLTRAHTHTHARTVSSHVLPALLVIPQTNYNVFSSSSFLLLHLPHSTLCFQLQLDLDKDGFSFSSLFFAALAKEGFAREITRKHGRSHARTRTLVDCITLLTLRFVQKKQKKNIFTNKQALPASPTSPHSPPACTIATSSIARGHQPLLPSLVFYRFASSSLPQTLSLRL